MLEKLAKEYERKVAFMCHGSDHGRFYKVSTEPSSRRGWDASRSAKVKVHVHVHVNVNVNVNVNMHSTTIITHPPPTLVYVRKETAVDRCFQVFVNDPPMVRTLRTM